MQNLFLHIKQNKRATSSQLDFWMDNERLTVLVWKWSIKYTASLLEICALRLKQKVEIKAFDTEEQERYTSMMIWWRFIEMWIFLSQMLTTTFLLKHFQYLNGTSWHGQIIVVQCVWITLNSKNDSFLFFCQKSKGNQLG